MQAELELTEKKVNDLREQAPSEAGTKLVEQLEIHISQQKEAIQNQIQVFIRISLHMFLEIIFVFNELQQALEKEIDELVRKINENQNLEGKVN